MIVIHDAAVRADRHVNACLFVVFISGLSDFDDRRSLAAADALLLSGDTDGAAAYADLHEVSAAVCQEVETVRVDYVARAYFDAVAVIISYPLESRCLPLGVAFRRVYRQDVYARVQQSRHSLFVVSCIDTGADYIPLVSIQQFIRMLLVRVVVLAENESLEPLIAIDYRQLVDLVVPDNVVCFRKRDAVMPVYHLVERCHEFRYRSIETHARDAVVLAGDDSKQLAGCRAVFSDGDGRMAFCRLEIEHILKRGVRLQVGVARYEAGLV